MYHIKSDKRSQSSAQLICDAMLRCLEEKPFKEISIVDLQKESTVGRSTFYRLFDRTEDVLQYIYEQKIQAMYDNYHALPEEGRPSFSLYILQNFYAYSPILETMIEANLTHLIVDTHNKYIPLYMKMYFQEEPLSTVSFDYVSALFSTMVVGIISVWIMHNKKETPEELYEILRTHLVMLAKIC